MHTRAAGLAVDWRFNRSMRPVERDGQTLGSGGQLRLWILRLAQAPTGPLIPWGFASVEVFDDLVCPRPLGPRHDQVDIASAEAVERMIGDTAGIDAHRA